MPVTMERFKKVLSGGANISPGLVASRKGKVDAALDGVDRQAGRLYSRDFVASIQGEQNHLPAAKKAIIKRRDAALALADDASRYAALDAIKADAKALEKSTKKKVEKTMKFLAKAVLEKRVPNSDAEKLAAVTESEGENFLKLANRVFLRAHTSGENISMLSVAEAVALLGYTGADFDPMNKMLNRLPPLPNAQQKAKLDLKVKLTAAALAKLPNYVGVSTRGDSAYPGIDAFYVAGTTVVVAAFLSTGVNFAFTADYAITVSGKTGKRVSGLSDQPQENEILFAPGTRFQVRAKDVSDPAKILIDLEEV